MTKVEDRLIKHHEDDATSVTLMMAEQQHELFDPVLIFKTQCSLDDCPVDLGYQ